MIFTGDWHQQFKVVMDLINKFGFENDDIIQVGDFGIGYNKDDNERLEALNAFLVSKNLHIWVIRGNHDDPRYFMGKYMYFYSNIHLIPDYTVLKIQDKNILFVGGAISIDRLRLKALMAKEEAAGELPIYFENEKFILKEKELSEFTNIDILVTHTSPGFCFPFGMGKLPAEDISLNHEVYEERTQMSRLVTLLLENNKITNHYYGHYHSSNVDVNGELTHTCLSINEFKELR